MNKLLFDDSTISDLTMLDSFSLGYFRLFKNLMNCENIILIDKINKAMLIYE
jgi:hypothetical protein